MRVFVCLFSANYPHDLRHDIHDINEEKEKFQEIGRVMSGERREDGFNTHQESIEWKEGEEADKKSRCPPQFLKIKAASFKESGDGVAREAAESLVLVGVPRSRIVQEFAVCHIVCRVGFVFVVEGEGDAKNDGRRNEKSLSFAFFAYPTFCFSGGVDGEEADEETDNHVLRGVDA